MPSSFSPDPERTLAAVLHALTDAGFGADLQGRIHTWNPAAAALLGYDATTIVGRQVSQLFALAQAADLDRIVQELKAGDSVSHGETCLVTNTGRTVRVAIAASPIHDSRGALIGFTIVARDIDDRVRHDIADARWRALIDAAVDAMIVIDGRGLVEEFNPAAEGMFGYQASDVVGRNVSMLMPSPDRDQHDQYIRRYLETGEQKIIGVGRDVTALRADGSRFPAHLSVGTMRVAGEPHFVGIIHDLSRRTTLEERVREQASLARLGEMAAVLAHEVRNPLTAVRGAIQVLGKRLGGGSRDAQIVTEILARLDGLNELVSDLLLFARTPQPRVAAIELRVVLSATTELLARDPQLSGIAIEFTGSAPPIPVDAELMKIAFQNVVLNAAQAMQGRGTIKAAIAADEHGQTVTIADNGPGILADVRERLFQPFFTTKARGTGLGLATVRRLVEAHGGTVSVECPAEGGTIVTFAIPSVSSTPSPPPRAATRQA